MGFRTFLSILLSVVIISLPCFGQDRTDREDTIRRREDSTTLREGAVTYRDDTITEPAIVIIDDLITYYDGLISYIEEFAYYRFGEYVDGIYFINLQTQEYIDSQIILDDGTVLDIGKIVGNLLIGATAIVVTAITMPYLVPTVSGKFIAITVLTNTSTAVLSGAITGTMKYIQTGGNLNHALISGTNNFMWTSIFLSGSEIASLALIYKIEPALRATKYARMVDKAINIINKLDPNRFYRQINAQHPYYTLTNSAGQIDTVFAPKLGLRQGVRPDNTTITQYIDWLRRQGIPNHTRYGDEGGHLIADLFGGSSYWDNIIPMASKLNHGDWRRMENFLYSNIVSGKNVENFYVKIIRATPTSRPTAFRVGYEIDGQYFIRMFANR